MFGSGFLKVSVVLLATLTELRSLESQPPTRCRDANDGWHDGANGADDDEFY